jgi:hypothetical protein
MVRLAFLLPAYLRLTQLCTLALVAHAQGGLTLGPEKSELAAGF